MAHRSRALTEEGALVVETRDQGLRRSPSGGRRRRVNPNDADRPAFDASAVLALMQGERGSEKLKDLQADAVVNTVSRRRC